VLQLVLQNHKWRNRCWFVFSSSTAIRPRASASSDSFKLVDGRNSESSPANSDPLSHRVVDVWEGSANCEWLTQAWTSLSETRGDQEGESCFIHGEGSHQRKRKRNRRLTRGCRPLARTHRSSLPQHGQIEMKSPLTGSVTFSPLKLHFCW
jgi:hypothetical protein